jgi:hypothetical protein
MVRGGKMAPSLRCKLGLHDWEWQYREPGHCEQVQVCRRDGARRPGQRVEHQWGAWTLVAPDRCIQVHTCGRCGLEETQFLEHVWGDWERNGEYANQKRVCARCGLSEEDGRCRYCGSPQGHRSDCPEVQRLL